MTAEHTPGPWATSGLFIVANPARDGRVIGKADPDDVGREAAERNAKLFAAAPDMLKALKAVLARIEFDSGHDIAPSTESLIRAAVTKAESR